MVGDKVVFMGGMGKNDRAWSLKEVCLAACLCFRQ